MLKYGMLFKINLMLSFLLILLLSSCQQIATPTKIIYKSSNNMPGGAYIFDSVKNNSQYDNSSQYTYKYDNFDFVSVYGVDKQRMTNIITTINPKYFDRIQNIRFIYSNKDAMSNSGTQIQSNYNQYTNKITIYVYDELDHIIKIMILHELKHHYCWQTANDISHDKCFLNTPIDKEYGFIPESL